MVLNFLMKIRIEFKTESIKSFQIQISAGDIINLESASHSKYYMLSLSGTWDEIIKLQ
jgi:hypothetical protein